MNLNKYIARLVELVESNPKYGELTVITASDDEGNDYNEVHFDPSLGNFEDAEFTLYEEDEDDDEQPDVNAVCVN